MKIIEVKNLKKQFGKNVVLDNINLEIKKGEVVSLIGPSGSGKSTILRSIIDLETITSGDILIEGNNLKDKKIKKEMLLKTGMVFQTFNLFPHMSVRNNIVKTLELVKKMDKKEANKIAEETLEVVGLIDKIDNFPSELSGGQKQRVALARVLMQNADLVLLDEPFSALDAISRYQLQNLAHELLKNKSVLLVTHDPQEALRLSQRIFVLRSPQSNQPALSDVIKPEGKAPRELNQENLWMLQQQLLNELLEGKR